MLPPSLLPSDFFFLTEFGIHGIAPRFEILQKVLGKRVPYAYQKTPRLSKLLGIRSPNIIFLSKRLIVVPGSSLAGTGKVVDH